MSSNWYLINSPYYTEGDETTNFNFDDGLGLSDVLTDTPLGSSITLCKGIYDGNTGLFATETISKGIIQNNSPDTVTKSWERQLIAPIGTLLDYKYVKCDGNLWLIMTKPASNKMYEKVVLYLCNYTAKWQDNDYNIICQPMFVSNASQYNSGEEGNKTVMIGYNQLLAYTSMDINSLKLNREKRMFIDYNTTNPTVYRITRVDSVSYSYADSRVLNLIFTEDEYSSATDRTDIMICDYKTPHIQPSTTIDITYSGNPQIRSGGSAKTFTAVSDNPIVLWEAIVASAYTDYVTVVPAPDNSLKCKVKCLQNDLMIGSTIRLKCTDNADNTGELLINIVGGV